MSAGEFNANAFESDKFTDRTRDIQVPALADYFKDGDAVFTVRGLTFDERIKCESLQSEAQAKAAEALAKLALGQVDKTVVNDIQAAMGWGDATQPATRVCIEKVVTGLVKPKLNRSVVGKISRVYPVVFNDLLEAIYKLTGQGQQIESKKSRPSGATKASEPA